MKTPKEDENTWRLKLEQVQLNDDKWTVKVLVIEPGGNPEERTYLNKFENYASEERRFVIKNICETETMFMVNQLGHEKKVKDEYSKVFEIGQSFLQNKEDIPSDILALIIKYQMLKIKEDHIFIRRQRLEVQEGLRRDSMTMLDKEEFKGHQIKAPLPEPEPPVSKGKGKEEELKIPEPNPEKKYNTSLRERGEEWRDRVYVDDFPTDGPNLYLAVTGFMNPFLPVNMLRIGIPVVAVVQIRIDVRKEDIPISLVRPGKKGQSQSDFLIGKFQSFWKDLQNLRLKLDTCEDLKDTAFITFKPPYCPKEPLSGDPEKIYDEITYLMYDVQDLCRQHLHFLDNMSIQEIPVQDVDERYNIAYSRLICYLPLECVMIYSVLDSILQVACLEEFIPDESTSSYTTTKVPAPASTKKVPRADSKKIAEDFNVAEAVDLVKNIFDTLCMTDADKKSYRITYGEEFENHTDPTVINYGDFVRYSTFHLCNLNLEDIVGQSLFAMPLHKLWLLQDLPEGVLDAKISFHVNMLLTSFDREDVETAELNRLIHILACRKLYNNRSSLKKAFISPTSLTEFKEIYLKRSIFSHPLTQASLQNSFIESRPLSFPSMTEMGNTAINFVDSSNSEEDHIKWLLDCPDIRELVSAAEIANNQPISHNLIDEFEFFEDFHGTCASQILLDAFNKFNCVDYKYCEVTDCIILMFFNSHNKDGISREEWRCHIPTAYCLQDFFDFVLDEHYDWIANEEKIYDESMVKRKQSSSSVVFEFIPPVSCIDDTNIGTDLLMEGSLKHAAMLEELEKAEAESEMLSTVPSPKKKVESSSTVKESKSKGGIHRKKNVSLSHWDASSTEEPVVKPFFGYDISDRRVELFGKDAMFFSRDRTKVSSLYTLFIPYNVEYIVLNIVPGDGANEFWVHRALGDFITPEILKKCEAFRINTKDQVMINIKKMSYEVPLIMPGNSHVEVTQPNESVLKSNLNAPISLSQEQLLPQFEIKSYYGLSITWPNGLIIETVYEKHSSNISHIKQYRLNPLPHLDEDCRCISLNGEIIIFKTSGEVVILKPDGTYIIVDKYEKRVIVPIIPEAELVQEKVKKGKNKEAKGKKKETEQVKEEKPPEYELYIESFEVIEPNGLRERYVEDIGYYVENLLIRTATDYCLGETFIRRMDGTYTLLNKDGLQIVTFPDKSKIITSFVIDEEEVYPEWMEGELEYLLAADTTNNFFRSKDSVKSPTGSVTASTVVEEEETRVKKDSSSDGYISVHLVYTVEHVNFATVTINKGNEEISISSPNDTSVTIDPNNNYSFKLDKVGQTTGYFNGEKLHLDYEACTECKSFTTCDVEFETKEDLDSVPSNADPSIQDHKPWVKLKDSFCQKIAVDNEGNITILDEPCSQEGFVGPEESNVEDRSQVAMSQDDSKSEDKYDGSITSSHGKCRELYQAKNIKFIVMNRDLSCSELVHRALLEDYKKECRWQPWCSMNTFNTFGDFRCLHSILMPISVTEPEKFLMKSITSDKPVNLTYKDLSTESKKGWYHWMRPYERFEPKSKMVEAHVTHKMPKGFILRTLEQQWNEDKREDLKGAKEMTRAILRYRRQLESDSETLHHVPIIDLRSEEERVTSNILQAVAHRMYENLKLDLEEDFQNRAKPSITTTPLPAAEMNIEGEQEDELDLEKYLMEERVSQLKALEIAAKFEDPVAKYWKIRAEAVKEEEFYLYLLREGKVPKYFLNVVGGACWWEINNLTDEAITMAQRRKMKCVCDESSSDNDTDNPNPGKSDDTTMPQIVFL